MEMTEQLPLAPLVSALADPPRLAIDRIAVMGFRSVQISAVQPGLRPRELDQSARRDLAATLRRRELQLAGIDAFIPTEHFLDPATISRAVDAVLASIGLAGDLGQCPVSVILPQSSQDNESMDEVIEAMVHVAQQRGVALADYALPVSRAMDETHGVGIDPPAWLAAGEDPAAAVNQHAAHLTVARLADLNTTGMRCPPGQHGGRLDVTSYRVALSITGYQRSVVLDARQWHDPIAGMHLAASAWHASSGVV